jgi:dihydroorotase-like cyclic amidohydrolase
MQIPLFFYLGDAIITYFPWGGAYFDNAALLDNLLAVRQENIALSALVSQLTDANAQLNNIVIRQEATIIAQVDQLSALSAENDSLRRWLKGTGTILGRLTVWLVVTAILYHING